jgi:photosystem II stability/assembly factor-like uncharacterized protein
VNRNLRSIYFTSSNTGFICGGKNLGNGVMYSTQNAGHSWSFTEYAHEYRSVCFKGMNHGVICGYGSLLVTHDGGNTFSPVGPGSYYFTSACLDNYGNFWIADFNGNVFSSTDNGNTWNRKRKQSSWNVSSRQVNCMDIGNDGRIVCAGPNGFVTWSDDGGATWNDRTTAGGNDIHSIKWITTGKVIAVGTGSGVYKLNI